MAEPVRNSLPDLSSNPSPSTPPKQDKASTVAQQALSNPSDGSSGSSAPKRWSCWDSFCDALRWLCDKIRSIFCGCCSRRPALPGPSSTPPSQRPPGTSGQSPSSPAKNPPAPVDDKNGQSKSLDAQQKTSPSNSGASPVALQLTDSHPLQKDKSDDVKGSDSKATPRASEIGRQVLLEILEDFQVPLMQYREFIDKLDFHSWQSILNLCSLCRTINSHKELLDRLRKEGGPLKNPKLASGKGEADVYAEYEKTLKELHEVLQSKVKKHSGTILRHITNLSIKTEYHPDIMECLQYLNDASINKDKVAKIRSILSSVVIPRSDQEDTAPIDSAFLGFFNPKEDYNRCYVNATLQIILRSKVIMDALRREPVMIVSPRNVNESEGDYKARLERTQKENEAEHELWKPLREILLKIADARDAGDRAEASHLIGLFRYSLIESGLKADLCLPYANQKDPAAIWEIVMYHLGLSVRHQTFRLSPQVEKMSEALPFPQVVMGLTSEYLEEQVIPGLRPGLNIGMGNPNPMAPVIVPIPTTERALDTPEFAKLSPRALVAKLNEESFDLTQIYNREFAPFVPEGRQDMQKHALMNVPDVIVVQLKRTLMVTKKFQERIINPLITQAKAWFRSEFEAENKIRIDKCSEAVQKMHEGQFEDWAKMQVHTELGISTVKVGHQEIYFRKFDNPVTVSEQFDIRGSVHPDRIGNLSTMYKLKGAVIHRGSVPSSGHYTNVVQDGLESYECDDKTVTILTKDEFLRKAQNGYLLVFERQKSPAEEGEIKEQHAVKT